MFLDILYSYYYYIIQIRIRIMKNRLKVFRVMHNMTQETLAEKLLITRQTVISIEKGKYDPSLSLAFRIAKLFDSRIEDIFLYEKSDKTEKRRWLK
jgi:putative transcriptional regulator